MKPDTADSEFTVQGNLGGEDFEMTFDPEGTVHLQSILSGQYSDTLLAVIREYSTNARDAHLEAGVDRPIEITLPSPTHSNFRVRDYGKGMTYEQIKKFISRYGASSKRDSDLFTGMLGIGIKSALAYQDAFSIISIAEGVRYQIAVTKDDRGLGHVTIVDQRDTDEESGVEVIVPVKGADLFAVESKCREFFQFWAKGTVLVNGVAPKHFTENTVTSAHEFVEDIWIVRTPRNNRIVMGGVAYRVDASLLDVGLDMNKFSLLVFVPVGAVAIAPSREALRIDTPRTRDALSDIKYVFNRSRDSEISRQIEAADSFRDAMQLALRWKATLKSAKHLSPTWQGEQVPFSFRSAQGFITTKGTTYKPTAYSTEHSIYITTAQEAVWVWNFTPERMGANHKKKMMQWLQDQNMITTVFVLCRGERQDIARWLDPSRQVDFSVISAIKLPRNVGKHVSNSVPRLSGSYEAYGARMVYGPTGSGLGSIIGPAGSTQVDEIKVFHEANMLAKNINASKPLYYVCTTNEARLTQRAASVARLLREVDGEHTIVLVQINRVKKFRRDFPTAVDTRTVLRRIYTQLNKKKWFRHKVYKYVHTYDSHRETLRALDPKRVKDRKLKAMIELAQPGFKKEALDNWNDFARLVAVADLLGNLPDVGIPNPLGPYPLLSYSAVKNYPDHAYMYVNAVYEAEKKEQAGA